MGVILENHSIIELDETNIINNNQNNQDNNNNENHQNINHNNNDDDNNPLIYSEKDLKISKENFLLCFNIISIISVISFFIISSILLYKDVTFIDENFEKHECLINNYWLNYDIRYCNEPDSDDYRYQCIDLTTIQVWWLPIYYNTPLAGGKIDSNLKSYKNGTEPWSGCQVACFQNIINLNYSVHHHKYSQNYSTIWTPNIKHLPIDIIEKHIKKNSTIDCYYNDDKPDHPILLFKPKPNKWGISMFVISTFFLVLLVTIMIVSFIKKKLVKIQRSFVIYIISIIILTIVFIILGVNTLIFVLNYVVMIKKYKTNQI